MVKRRDIKRNGERGNAIVEFALVFILFVTVVVALIEFGRAIWTYTTVIHATRQAGRYCMVRGSLDPTTLADVRAVVERHATGLESSKIGLTGSWGDVVDDPSGVERGAVIELTVTYPFQFVTGSLLVTNSAIPMSSTTRTLAAN